MILTVTLNPSVDHQIFVDQLQVHDTNRVVRTEVDAGGKAVNLARVHVELGGSAIATGFLGGSGGAVIQRVLEQQGVRSEFVEIAGATRVNISVEDASGAAPTTFNERGPDISAHEFSSLLSTIERLAGSATWLCMGGSLPQGVSTDVYQQIGHLARSLGCKVLLDADKDPCIEGLKAHPDFIKPNQAEASRILGRELITQEDVIDGAQELYRRLREGSAEPVVVISRGADGAIMVCHEGVFNGRSAPVEPKSTIGSGDSFLGAMLWAIEDRQEITDAFRWGLAAGAATATTDGTEIARKRVCEILFAHTEVQKL